MKLLFYLNCVLIVTVASVKDVCELKLETGPCKRLFHRFGYDPEKGECVVFVYGGCQGNANNFETREECEAQCVETRSTTPKPELTSSAPQTTEPVPTPKSVCDLKLEPGPCKAGFRRFGYDSSKGKCVIFIYGECEGNGNNFATREKCEAQCVERRRTTPKPGLTSSAPQTTEPVPTPKSVCDLKLEPGPCKAGFRRFGYDSSKGKCVIFIYGGCEGNGNNFATREKCEAQCVETRSTTPKPELTSSAPQTTEPVPTPKSVCDLKLEPGPCKSGFRRFGYDSSKGKCVIFIYGGCEGNGNNFATREKCEAQCVETRSTTPKPELTSSAPQTTEPVPTPKSVCDLKLEPGPCKAGFRRFGYDSSKGKCVIFIYGGCEGNGNNFATREKCEAQCVETRSTTPKPELTSSAPQTTEPVPTPKSVCDLKLEPGPCKAGFRRFGYDSSKGKCVIFIYGGCEGNGNNFATREKCEAQCVETRSTTPKPELTSSAPQTTEPVPTPKSVCDLKLEPGPCKAGFRRFGYDSSKGKCVIFIYGGCEGNGNNFATREKCEAQCVETRRTTPKPELTSSAPQTTEPVPTPKSVCDLKLEPGPCKAGFRRFGYDSSKGKQCVIFIYGGCEGNGNNFATREKCEAQCVETRSTTPKPELTSSAPQTTEPVPTPKSVCDLKLEPGPCKAGFRRFGYDSSKGKCVIFIYGGCEGNGNNFATREKCEAQCVETRSTTPKPELTSSAPQTTEPVPTPKSVCDLKLEPGPCKAGFRRFGYDSSKGKCVIFIYGGCEGNGNNFATREKCEAQCVERRRTTPKPGLTSSAPQTTEPVPTPKSVCDLKLEPGPCKAGFRRFGYDSSKGKCVIFIYGGCEGNGNNFATREKCEAQCVETRSTTPKPELTSSAPQTTEPVPTPKSVCDLKLEPGPCKAGFRRFGYDSSKGKCVIFIYGGCEGNENNFLTMRECEQRCEKWRRTPLLPE